MLGLTLRSEQKIPTVKVITQSFQENICSYHSGKSTNATSFLHKCTLKGIDLGSKSCLCGWVFVWVGRGGSIELEGKKTVPVKEAGHLIWEYIAWCLIE